MTLYALGEKNQKIQDELAALGHSLVHPVDTAFGLHFHKDHLKLLSAAEGVLLFKGWEAQSALYPHLCVGFVSGLPFYYYGPSGLVDANLLVDFDITPLLPSDYLKEIL